MAAPAVGEEREVGPAVRAFVWSFLAVFVLCGLASLELWPFTGWHLFSHVRTDRVSGWEVTTVDALGEERPVPFADLPAGYRSWTHVAAGLPALSDDDRLAVCRAWAAADATRRQVVEVRVYATEEPLRDPAARRRELRHVCDVAHAS